MRFLALTLALTLALVLAPAPSHAQARVADDASPAIPADIRGLAPGQRVRLRAFLGDCRRALAARGTVAGWTGDTMTVDLEPRGTTLAGEQLAIPIATIHSLHVSRSRDGDGTGRRGREAWVEVKRPAGMRLERSCPATVPSPLPGMSRPGIPPV